MENLKTENPFSLNGEYALVTGGGSGLGLAMAKCLAASGAKVIVVGRREETLKEAAESIGEKGYALAHDVTRLDEASQLADKARTLAGLLCIWPLRLPNL